MSCWKNEDDLEKRVNRFMEYSIKFDFVTATEEDIKDDYILSEERIGWLYNKLKNYIEAEKHLRKAIDLGDDDEWIYSQLGYNLRCQDRYEEAIENLLKSRQISLDEEDVVDGEDLELAFCYVGIGDKEKAEEYAAKIEERLLKAYQRIRESVVNRLAVVPIQRGASGGSFFTIPPQVQVEIASRKKIITDEHSGRILVDAALADEEKEKMEALFKSFQSQP